MKSPPMSQIQLSAMSLWEQSRRHLSCFIRSHLVFDSILPNRIYGFCNQPIGEHFDQSRGIMVNSFRATVRANCALATQLNGFDKTTIKSD